MALAILLCVLAQLVWDALSKIEATSSTLLSQRSVFPLEPETRIYQGPRSPEDVPTMARKDSPSSPYSLTSNSSLAGFLTFPWTSSNS